MDFFLKVNPDGYVALARDGHSAYDVDLIVKTDHQPNEGDLAATVVVKFGKRLPDPD